MSTKAKTRALLATVLFVLAAFVTFGMWQEAKRLKAVTKERALARSRNITLQIERFVAATDIMLQTLARTPTVRNQEAEAAKAIFYQLLKEHPEYANIWATRADGWNYANPLPNPSGKPIYIGDRAYFKKAIATGGLAIESVPDSRQNPTKFAVAMSRGVNSEHGRANGTVQAAFEILPIQKIVDLSDAPAGGTITIVDEVGYVIAASADPNRLVGTLATGTALWQEMQSNDSGVSETPFFGGAEHLIGYSTTRLARWKVVESVPVATAYAELLPSLLRLLAILLVPVVAMMYLASRLVRIALARDRAFVIADEAREAAEAANQSLNIANEQKNRFIAMVSHELRGPISVIRSGIAVANHPVADAKQKSQALRMIDSQSMEMSHIIDDLLDLSRISRNQIVLNREVHDIQGCVEDAITRAAAKLAAKHQKLEVTATASIKANVDRTRILQVLGNLLDNASKYCPLGASIEVSLRRDGDSVVVEVLDNGPGIPADLLPKIFDTERTVLTRSSESGGLGVGLALCKRLVELHGGSISAANRTDGPGARLAFLIPASAVGSEAEPRT